MWTSGIAREPRGKQGKSKPQAWHSTKAFGRCVLRRGFRSTDQCAPAQIECGMGSAQEWSRSVTSKASTASRPPLATGPKKGLPENRQAHKTTGGNAQKLGGLTRSKWGDQPTCPILKLVLMGNAVACRVSRKSICLDRRDIHKFAERNVSFSHQLVSQPSLAPLAHFAGLFVFGQ